MTVLWPRRRNKVHSSLIFVLFLYCIAQFFHSLGIEYQGQKINNNNNNHQLDQPVITRITSPPPAIQKTAFLHAFCFLIFHLFSRGSADPTCPYVRTPMDVFVINQGERVSVLNDESWNTHCLLNVWDSTVGWLTVRPQSAKRSALLTTVH